MKTLISLHNPPTQRKQMSLNMKVFTAALLLFMGTVVSNSVKAASCMTYIQNQVDWVAQSPSTRGISLTMVSNEAKRGFPVGIPTPEASYMVTSLNKSKWFVGGGPFGIFVDTLFGNGGAMFNNHAWYHSFGDPHPFNPHSTENWTVRLIPSSTALRVSRNGNNYQFPLDCEGSLISGTYTHYFNTGQFKWPLKDTKYVVSLVRYHKPGPPR